MTRRLERVTVGVWGDPKTGHLHIDCVELNELLLRRRGFTLDPYVVGVRALREGREAGVRGLLIAHVHGMPARLGVRL